MARTHSIRATRENGGIDMALTQSNSPTLSERAISTMSRDGSSSERLSDLPEQWRLASEKWVELDGAARLLEDSSKTVFSQIMTEWENIPVNKAEHKSRQDQRYVDIRKEANEMRTQANLAKVLADYMKMRFEMYRTSESSRRAEMSLR